MIKFGNKLRLTEEEKKNFRESTGMPVPDTVDAYNAAIKQTAARWHQIGQQENSAEAKLLAAIMKDETI